MPVIRVSEETAEKLEKIREHFDKKREWRWGHYSWEDCFKEVTKLLEEKCNIPPAVKKVTVKTPAIKKVTK